jgi:hypothetical protein
MSEIEAVDQNFKQTSKQDSKPKSSKFVNWYIFGIGLSLFFLGFTVQGKIKNSRKFTWNHAS